MANEEKKEKRSFKRYENQSQCEIKLGTEIYKGTVIDYSATGASAIVENASHFLAGSRVDITFLDSEIKFEGEVVWVEELSDANNIRVGFKRVDKLSGSLKDFRLADILLGLQKSTKSGFLEVKRGPIVKRIFIKNGDMIFASSNNEDERLGELLLKEGKITFEKYKQSSYLLMKTGEKLGKILVELGCLTPKELFGAVRYQIEEIILSLFTLEEGSFEFKEEPIPQEEVITLQISAANIIYKGIKRISNFAYIKQMCPQIDDVLNPSANPLNIFQYVGLEEHDKRILSYINGFYSLRTILSLSPVKNFEALKTICALLSIGLIKIKEENEDPARLPVEYIFGEPEEKAPNEFLQKIEEMYNKCRTQGYYEVLGVGKDASSEEIKKAYYRLSKEFHPDRHFSFPAHDIKGKLMKIISYTTEAHETLSHPGRRMEYNLSLSLKASETAKKMEAVSPIEEPQVVETPEREEDVTSIEEQKESAGTKAEITAGEFDIIEVEKVAEEKTEVHGKRLEMAEEVTGIQKEGTTEEVPESIMLQLLSEEKVVPEEAKIEQILEQDAVLPEGPPKIHEEKSALKEEAYVKKEEAPEQAAIQAPSKSEVITEKVQPKKTWLYTPIAIIIMIILTVAAFVTYKNSHKGPPGQTHPVGEKKLQLPPFRDELFKNLLAETPARKLSLSPFRDELFMKMSNETSEQE